MHAVVACDSAFTMSCCMSSSPRSFHRPSSFLRISILPHCAASFLRVSLRPRPRASRTAKAAATIDCALSPPSSASTAMMSSTLRTSSAFALSGSAAPPSCSAALPGKLGATKANAMQPAPNPSRHIHRPERSEHLHKLCRCLSARIIARQTTAKQLRQPVSTSSWKAPVGMLCSTASNPVTARTVRRTQAAAKSLHPQTHSGQEPVTAARTTIARSSSLPRVASHAPHSTKRPSSILTMFRGDITQPCCESMLAVRTMHDTTSHKKQRLPAAANPSANALQAPSASHERHTVDAELPMRIQAPSSKGAK